MAGRSGSRFAGVAVPVLLAVVLMGADKGGCGPIDPPVRSTDQCAVAADCEGLPHVLCLGAWTCGSGACRWKCDTASPACTADSQCPDGQACDIAIGNCVDVPVPPTCVAAGCSGELCVPESQAGVASDCLWADWYACLKHTTCGNFGAYGQCGWQPTDAFRACMEELTCGDGVACAPGHACVDGTCQPIETPVTCLADSDCPEGQVCNWNGPCPPCDCDPAAGDCLCPACDVAAYGTCVPACVSIGYEACGNGVDDDCNGIVDDGCPVTLSCTSDADCAAYEWCNRAPFVDDFDPDGTMNCCPANAKCMPDVPPCGGTGVCEPLPGYCRSDADCPVGDVCVFQGGCSPCECAPDDPACGCPDCVAVLAGRCVPSGCVDLDGDGHCAGEDCDDANAAVHPGQPDACNGVDDDCDGVADPDCGPGCLDDTDCASYEHCRLDFVADASGTACCPPNALCDPSIPPCGGTCVLNPGYCWTDSDCADGQHCAATWCDPATGTWCIGPYLCESAS